MDFSQHTNEKVEDWHSRLLKADRSNLSKSECEYLDRCTNTALYRSRIEARARGEKLKEGGN